MKNIKKILSVLVFLILCFIVSGTVNAEDLYETVDPRSSYSFSTALELEDGKIYYRNYSSNLHSRKWYSTFVVDENSYAMIGFSSKYYYEVSIYDENYNLVIDLGSKKDYSGYFPFKKGKYYIMLNNDAFSTNSVSLSYNLQRSVSCEIEPNDTFSEATEILFDKNYLIFIGEPGNKDYLSFNTEGYKNVRISVDGYEKAKIFMRLYESDRSTYKILTLKYDDMDDVYYYEFEPKYSGVHFIETYSYSDEICYSIAIKGGHEHTYITTVTKMATCSVAGSQERSCSCGDTKTEIIPAINHANATLDNGSPATCTQIGFTVGKYCPDCDTWLEGHKTIPVTAHSYTSIITQEPTCWKEGVTTYTCTCGDSYTETIQKKDHEYRPWETKVKPKCTQPGMEWSYCLICDSDFEREIPATGHTVIEYVMRATTDEHAAYGGDGAYMTACDVCNEVFKQEFFARPAEYVLSTTECTYNGKARKPSVTVKDADGKTLIEGQDYDLIYPDEMKLPGKYNIKVLFKGNYLGGKDLTFTIAPKRTTGVKAKTQTTSSITLTWTKTTGATGYRVYQYSPSKGEYVLKKSIKGTTTYKVTGLKAGTTYKFKIKPYVKSDDGTVIWGSASSVLSTATKPSTPTVKSVTASSGKATLSWNNISGESGYYSTSKNGTYKKMKSVSADTVKYTTSKLTAGKTYYFKVRAYKKVDGKTIFGSFSDIKYIKVPAVYYITKTGEKYHVDGCRSLSRSKIQISYSNAVARGYEPCDACILK